MKRLSIFQLTVLRWLVITLLLSLIAISSSAQDVRVTTVELSDEQTAEIIPLIDDFEGFYDLVTGSGGGRFSDCATAWTALNETFEIEIPEDPNFQFIRRWDVTANQIPPQVIDVIENVLVESANVLPGSNIRVCVVPAPPDAIEQAQNELYAVANGNIIIVAMGGLPVNWVVQLESLIAHEYHHTVRSSASDREEVQNSLLERLVTEGMAVAFAQIIVPEYADPVLRGVPAERETQLWQEMLQFLQTEDKETIAHYLWGRDDDTIPANAGYTIGYHLIQSYLATHPTMPIAEWTIADSQVILEDGGYNP